jgi:lipopolysaccharide/colanic/teichoic acid biosynthesis glycosyltransferase
MPLLLLVACLIKLDSPGPLLFRQARLGLNGLAARAAVFRRATRAGHSTL